MPDTAARDHRTDNARRPATRRITLRALCVAAFIISLDSK